MRAMLEMDQCSNNRLVLVHALGLGPSTSNPFPKNPLQIFVSELLVSTGRAIPEISAVHIYLPTDDRRGMASLT